MLLDTGGDVTFFQALQRRRFVKSVPEGEEGRVEEPPTPTPTLAPLPPHAADLIKGTLAAGDDGLPPDEAAELLITTLSATLEPPPTHRDSSIQVTATTEQGIQAEEEPPSQPQTEDPQIEEPRAEVGEEIAEFSDEAPEPQEEPVEPAEHPVEPVMEESNSPQQAPQRQAPQLPAPPAPVQQPHHFMHYPHMPYAAPDPWMPWHHHHHHHHHHHYHQLQHRQPPQPQQPAPKPPVEVPRAPPPPPAKKQHVPLPMPRSDDKEPGDIKQLEENLLTVMGSVAAPAMHEQEDTATTADELFSKFKSSMSVIEALDTALTQVDSLQQQVVEASAKEQMVHLQNAMTRLEKAQRGLGGVVGKQALKTLVQQHTVASSLREGKQVQAVPRQVQVGVQSPRSVKSHQSQGHGHGHSHSHKRREADDGQLRVTVERETIAEEQPAKYYWKRVASGKRRSKKDPLYRQLVQEKREEPTMQPSTPVQHVETKASPKPSYTSLSSTMSQSGSRAGGSISTSAEYTDGFESIAYDNDFAEPEVDFQ